MILRELTDEINLKPINDIQTNSLINVASGSQQTILTLNATVEHRIVRISCSGEAYAVYQLYIDTNLIETKIVGERSVDFLFSVPLLLSIGEILDVKVIHYYTGNTFNFNSTIYSRV